MQFSKLHEQIKIRDEMLGQARKRFKVEGMDFDLDDPRLLQLDEMINQQSIFPPINNASYGKATNNLIKSLLNNVIGER
jgi:hypothetical protein